MCDSQSTNITCACPGQLSLKAAVTKERHEYIKHLDTSLAAQRILDAEAGRPVKMSWEILDTLMGYICQDMRLPEPLISYHVGGIKDQSI